MLALDILLDVVPRLLMGEEVHLAPQLLPHTADVLQPLVEAHLILRLRGDGQHHLAPGVRRHQAAQNHHLAVGALQQALANQTEEGIGHVGLVVQTNHHLTHILLHHGMDNARGHVGADAVDGLHLDVSRHSDAHRPLQVDLCLLAPAVVAVIIVRYREAQQTVRHLGVTYHHRKLRQHIHRHRVRVGNHTAAVAAASVPL